MRALAIFLGLLLSCASAWSATTVFPASTNGNNVFTGSNVFTKIMTGNGAGLTNIFSTNINGTVDITVTNNDFGGITAKYIGGNGIGLTNVPFYTNVGTAWVDVNGSDTLGIIGRQDKPFASISNACYVAGQSNTIIVNSGDYYPRIGQSSVMRNGQTIVGLGEPRIWWSWKFVGSAAPPTNSICIVVSNNCTLKGLTFISTNLSPAQGFLGSWHANDTDGISPGFTNVLFDGCKFFGKTDVLFDIGTNVFQSIWHNCYFETAWDTIVCSSFSSIWEFNSCQFSLLDSSIAQPTANFKNVFNAPGPGTLTYNGCRFTDHAAVDDSAYQTWIVESTPGAQISFLSCQFDNGQFLFGDAPTASRVSIYGPFSIPVDFAPGVVMSAGTTATIATTNNTDLVWLHFTNGLFFGATTNTP